MKSTTEGYLFGCPHCGDGTRTLGRLLAWHGTLSSVVFKCKDCGGFMELARDKATDRVFYILLRHQDPLSVNAQQ